MKTDPNDIRAPYLQMADQLRAEIRSGVYGPGDKLPSARDLGETFNVASNTVQNALRVLKSDGLIYSVTGRGNFVRDELPANDEAPAPAAEGPTPEFVAIMQQLDAVSRELRGLSHRVSEIESLVKPGTTQGR